MSIHLLAFPHKSSSCTKDILLPFLTLLIHIESVYQLNLLLFSWTRDF